MNISELNAEKIVALDEKMALNRPLVVKLGFDPTSPDLHFGHYVALRGLKKFQENGHIAHIIIGDFTAAIGDPSGRNKLRPPLTKEDISQHAQTYLSQVFLILDKDKTLVSSNSTWLNMNMEQVLRIMSTQTISQIMAREDFSNRFKDGVPIFMHEMMYPIMQGMDSVAINADVELGGTDQTFNLMMGRDMQSIHKMAQQAVITFPLLVGLDGEKKMSKSLGNHIALLDTPKDIFGKVMSISDETMWNYWSILMGSTPDEIQAMKDSGTNPKNIKMDLAQKVVSILHPENVAIAARDDFNNQFSKKEVDLDSVETAEIRVADGKQLSKIMNDVSLATSRADAVRLIKGGGVKVDGEKVTDVNLVILPGDHFLLQVGKLKYLKIKTVE